MRAIILSAMLGLGACGSNEGLRDMRSDTGGPDEFAIVPNAPLDIPDTLSLPTPTPGGTNRTDATPLADAITVLGGTPSAASTGGIPSADQQLVAQASRNGVDPAIRSTLAQEDAAFRARQSRLAVFNILGQDQYFRAYVQQKLDAYAELNRFRAAGVQTPTAPPR